MPGVDLIATADTRGKRVDRPMCLQWQYGESPYTGEFVLVDRCWDGVRANAPVERTRSGNDAWTFTISHEVNLPSRLTIQAEAESLITGASDVLPGEEGEALSDTGVDLYLLESSAS
jgi:hypothetical protein